MLFAVTFSLATISGPPSSNFHLPSVPLARAVPQIGPCMTTGSSSAASECWYPAGPEMSTLLFNIFNGATAEYSSLTSANPTIDFSDSPVPPASYSQLNSPGYYLTGQVPTLGYDELQFMQANTFWNCAFSFGTSACGVQIRQGIAHMIDKTVFASSEGPCPPTCLTPIDNPVSTTYGLTNSVPVASLSFGVAVNYVTDMVYVTNQGSTNVFAFPGSTMANPVTITAGSAPAGLAVNTSTNTIYVANGNSNTVSVINGATNLVTSTIPVGTTPTWVAVDSQTNTIYVTNSGSNTVSVISGSSNTVTATIPVGTKPEGVAVNPSTDMIYVANEMSNTVSVISGATNTVTATISTAPQTGAYGVALNPNTNNLYVTNSASNTVSKISTTTNLVLYTVPVGMNPVGIALDLNSNTVFVTNDGSSSLSVIPGYSTIAIETVSVGNAPIGVAVNGAVYVVSFSSASLFIVAPTANAGLTTPNPCSQYDSSFVQNAPGCEIGASGGTAYHLATATGVASVNCSWCQAPGSLDLNAAAQHFVNAGLATGFNTATSVLTGKVAAGIVPNIFIVNTDPLLSALGNSIAAQICYVFMGSYVTPCPYLSTTPGPPFSFTGYTTGTTGVNLSWWIFTGSYAYSPFYVNSLYDYYNSRFVSGVPAIQTPTGTCSAQSVPSAGASNYMYLCNPTYDTLSSQTEMSPCLSAPGDPIPGSFPNTPPSSGGVCTGVVLSSHSAGIEAEASFGQNVLTLPVIEQNVQFGYLQCQPPRPCTTSNSWVRAINDAGTGLPNYFTWLNAYNPGPAIAGTIRQGFASSIFEVNPFIATGPESEYVVRSVYDSLLQENPLSTNQFINWMTESDSMLSALIYTPPPGTVVTYRFTLRPDLTWQDRTPVTAYDVAFTYLSMVGSGAFLGSVASTMTGITVLGLRTFDINLNSLGPFVLPNIGSVPIVPGRFWTNAGRSFWDNAVGTCSTSSSCGIAQYTLSGSAVNPCIVISGTACSIFPNTLMTINPADISAGFDPIHSQIMVGSGPWTCGFVTSSGSGLCTSNAVGNGQSMSMSLSANPNYFRSSLTLAKYIWSGEGDLNAIGPASAVGSCFNVSPPSLSGTCSHWQQGAGNPNTAATGTVVGITAVQIVDIFFNLNWLFPFEWASNPPIGIAASPPLLYSLTPFLGSNILTPNPGGTSCTTLNSYYDC